MDGMPQSRKKFHIRCHDERYPYPLFVRWAISARVTSLHSQEVSINEVSVEREDDSHNFKALFSVEAGRAISFSEPELPLVPSVCGECGILNCLAGP
jgi:hypothetical protein